MILRAVVAAGLIVGAGALALADPPNLAFEPDGDGNYVFDTGVLKGRLKLDDKYQGVYPLVHVASDRELVNPPGVFSFYRVLTTNGRYGNAARDWPTITKRLADGAVEAGWPAAEEHPIEMTAVYRWTAADTLDLETTVTPQRDMPQFELFISSYFTEAFRARVYVEPGEGTLSAPCFVPVDKKSESTSRYVMFPRDDGAIAMIRDGRWAIPPNPVDWAIGHRLAAPLAMRRDAAAGQTARMMCPPDECFAVASPWNPAMPEARGYRSLYLSLVGRNLKARQTARARCRLVICKDLSDEQAVQCYDNYLAQQQER